MMYMYWIFISVLGRYHQNVSDYELKWKWFKIETVILGVKTGHTIPENYLCST